MKKLVIAALMAAVAAPAMAEDAANVSPALWVVEDADTKIYLFGTVHALDGKQAWFNDEVKTAYDASQELVLEAILPEPASVQGKVLKLAIDTSGKTLTSKLTPEVAGLLKAELTKAGAPANAFDMFEPWFVSTALAAITFQKMGIKPEHGVEEVLRAAAKKDGKAIGELESFDWQMNLFDTLPEELQIAMLSSSLENMAEAETMMTKLVTSWSSGDVEGLATIMNEAMLETPGLGKVLLADRNERWAEWIDARMDKPGTVFVAVGAGHLGGPDSVQAMLAKHGLKAERVAAE